MKKDFYIDIQNEIFEGFTRFDFKGQAVFFRHFNFKDQGVLHSSFDRYRQKAINRGIQEEQDVLEKLAEEKQRLNEIGSAESTDDLLRLKTATDIVNGWFIWNQI